MSLVLRCERQAELEERTFSDNVQATIHIENKKVFLFPEMDGMTPSSSGGYLASAGHVLDSTFSAA